MAYREIPEGSVEIQTGLYLYSYNKTIGGREYTFRQLFSSEGYCFYDKTVEIYDEDLNPLPDDQILPTQRQYMRWCSLGLTTDVNNFVSVPVDDSYEIVNGFDDSVTA